MHSSAIGVQASSMITTGIINLMCMSDMPKVELSTVSCPALTA